MGLYFLDFVVLERGEGRNATSGSTKLNFTGEKLMVFAQCSNCMRNLSVPSNSAKPNRHVCQVCKSPFCNMCGTPFICRKCLALLDMNDQRTIRQQGEKYRGKAGGGIAMTVTGGVLLTIAGYTVYYWLLAYYLTFSFSIFAIAPIFEAVFGLGLLIGGLSTLSNSKNILLNCIRQTSAHARPLSTVGSTPTGASSWVANLPAIPSSAYIPVLQALPSQPASIPVSAYIPESRLSPAVLDSSGQYCGQCGDLLPEVTGLKFCPSCGSPRN